MTEVARRSSIINLTKPWLLGVTAFVLAVFFYMPVKEAMTPTLDASNYGSYSYFTAHHLAYGSEVIPMAGPYGFIMYGWTYNGELYWWRMVGEFVVKAVLAGLTLWFFRRAQHGPMRWIWLVAHLAFTQFTDDLPLEWVLLLGGLFLMRPFEGAKESTLSALVAAAVALVSLIKGTQLILGVATIGVVLGLHLFDRRWRRAAVVAGSFVFSLGALWLAAGQSLGDVPGYVRGILELGGGYTEAMSLATEPVHLARGLLVSVALAATLGVAAWRLSRNLEVVAAVLLLAGHTFVQWKHAFVRSDGHVYIYFHFTLVAAATIAVIARSASPTSAAMRPVLIPATLAVAFSLVPWRTWEPMLPSPTRAAAIAWERLPVSFAQLRAPVRTKAAFDLKLDAQRREHMLPLVKATVAEAPIDVFGVEHGLVPLNGLRYAPRPMGGGPFNVYTPRLMELNRAFLVDPARQPAFYLLKLQGIDGRLPAQEDGLALREILQRYRPLSYEHEHLLLALDRTAASAPERAVAKLTASWGQTVPVPAVLPHEMLMARVAIRPNALGRLRNLLYKPGRVFGEFLLEDGSREAHRMIPAMMTSAFVLSPLLENTSDILALYAPGEGRIIKEVIFRNEAPGTFAPSFEIEFLASPKPPELSASAQAEFRARLQFPFANAVPESITPPFRPHHSVRFLHAPAEAVWNLTGNERTLEFHYGIDPEAYERGTTNGVNFFVELRGPSGATRPVFQRSLSPRHRPEDAGDQVAQVDLPLYVPGSRLVIRTDPGEHGDNAWDWSYVNRILISSSSPLPTRFFPGFNRIPDTAEAEHADALETDGRKVLLLHVPGIMRFALKPGDREVRVGFGFLPGAYTAGGNTAGAAYVAEIHAAGLPPREIARRELRPLEHDSDRGEQAMRVSLPAHQPGDVLVIKTLPLLDGRTDWGWTYISRFEIE